MNRSNVWPRLCVAPHTLWCSPTDSMRSSKFRVSQIIIWTLKSPMKIKRYMPRRCGQTHLKIPLLVSGDLDTCLIQRRWCGTLTCVQNRFQKGHTAVGTYRELWTYIEKISRRFCSQKALPQGKIRELCKCISGILKCSFQMHST